MRKEGRIGEGKVGQEEESSAIYSSVLAVTWKQQISVNGTQTCKRLTCACVVVIPVDAVSMETVVVGVFWEQLNQRVMVWYHEDVFLLLHLSFPTRYTNGTMIKRTTATANTIPRMALSFPCMVLFSWQKFHVTTWWLAHCGSEAFNSKFASSSPNDYVYIWGIGSILKLWLCMWACSNWGHAMLWETNVCKHYAPRLLLIAIWAILDLSSCYCRIQKCQQLHFFLQKSREAIANIVAVVPTSLYIQPKIHHYTTVTAM